jgi:hypothetical protein
MGLGHADGYGITCCLLTRRSKGPMALTVGSTTTTSMQNHSSQTQISIGQKDLLMTIVRCSFQSLAVDTSSTMPWESWVTWDLLQKSTGSAPIEKSTLASTESRMPSMPSFYKLKQHIPSLSTTSLGLVPPPASGPKYSVSPSMNNNPMLDPVLHPLPRLAFPQSSLAKALLTGPITLTYKAKSASPAERRMATVPATPTVSHVEHGEITPTSIAKRSVSGAATNTPPPFVRTCMSHACKMNVSSPFHTLTMD